ncbi:hypothetical protein GCM10015534_25590 [Streptomyces diastaticus subsp. diastaticus]|nr:hypothetical protein GCM10015534_25590 [Streptomyces diastaticus subsp. diastaticus]
MSCGSLHRWCAGNGRAERRPGSAPGRIRKTSHRRHPRAANNRVADHPRTSGIVYVVATEHRPKAGLRGGIPGGVAQPSQVRILAPPHWVEIPSDLA